MTFPFSFLLKNGGWISTLSTPPPPCIRPWTPVTPTLKGNEKSGVKSKGNGTHFEFGGGSSYPSSGFYCIYVILDNLTHKPRFRVAFFLLLPRQQHKKNTHVKQYEDVRSLIDILFWRFDRFQELLKGDFEKSSGTVRFINVTKT